MTNVLQDTLESRFPPNIANGVLCRFKGADADARRSDGLIAAHAGCKILVDGSLEIGSQLVVQILFDLSSPKKRVQPRQQPTHQISPSDARMIREMAAV